MTDNFAERMKYYESFESERRLYPLLPVIARMDGICFHKFTKDLKKPFDENFSKLMVEVAEFLLQYFGAYAAYTQSDEITLGWNLESYDSELFCGGRIQKLTSHLASKTSVHFNKLLPNYLENKLNSEPCFDARVFSVPNLTEAANEFLWREQDAFKNAISMAAHAHFSHEEVMNKNGSEMQEMLFQQKNINFNDYPPAFKRGTFLVRRKVHSCWTKEELETLPEKHHARKNENLTVERIKVIRFTDLPKFSTISNREGFLFYNQEPIKDAKSS